MKHLLLLSVFLLGVVMFSGCAFTPVIPPRGIFYTAQRAPLFPAGQIGRMRGASSAYNIMGMVGWGDCSIATAAGNGGITNIKNTEYEMTNYFIFYQKFTVVVYGDRTIPDPQLKNVRR